MSLNFPFSACKYLLIMSLGIICLGKLNTLSKIWFKLLICLAKSYIARRQIQLCCGKIITNYKLVASELMRFYYNTKQHYFLCLIFISTRKDQIKPKGKRKRKELPLLSVFPVNIWNGDDFFFNFICKGLKRCLYCLPQFDLD